MFFCSICDVNFSQITHLLRHYKYYHGFTDTSSYTCAQNSCFRRFSTKKSFEKHLESHKIDSPISSTFQSQHVPIIKHEANYIDLDCKKNESSSLKIPFQEAQPLCESKELKSLQSVKAQLRNTVLLILSRLYGVRAMSDSTIQTFVVEMKHLLFVIVTDILKPAITSILEDNKSTSKAINSYLDATLNPFEKLDTNYLRSKYLDENRFYVKPEPIIIGNELQSKPMKDGKKCYTNSEIVGQYVSIVKTLKNYMESADNFKVLNTFMEEIDNGPPNVLHNFCQGTLWKNIKNRFPNSYAIPLFIYFDDFGVDNPLGSHNSSNKVGGVYYCIPSFPQYYLSKLKNIFIAMMFPSESRTQYGNAAVFQPLIDDLLMLENEGLLINIDNETYKIHFCMSLFLGDNLGLNSVLGFVSSFSANFPCRTCKLRIDEIRSAVKLKSDSLRNNKNYNDDLKIGNVKMTGVKEVCIFNQLKSFNVIENQMYDLMHDLPLGVFRYDLALLINYLIETYKISLNAINARILSFHYGFYEKDKPPAIKESHLQNKQLSMYASEMITLVLHLPLIVGDLFAEEDQCWKWFLIMRKLFDLLLLKRIELECKILIEDMAISYLTKRKELFPSEPLKPKHHFMLHYADLLSSNGPMVNYWCMRMEAMHRFLGTYAKVCKNHKNICLSMIRKHQAAVAYELSCDPAPNIKECTSEKIKTPINELQYHESFSVTVPLSSNCFITNLKYVDFNQFRYKLHNFIVEESDGLEPVFMEIIYILKYENQIYFIGKRWNTVGYKEHVHAFIILPSESWSTIKCDGVISDPLFKYCSSDGKCCIMLNQ